MNEPVDKLSFHACSYEISGLMRDDRAKQILDRMISLYIGAEEANDRAQEELGNMEGERDEYLAHLIDIHAITSAVGTGFKDERDLHEVLTTTEKIIKDYQPL